MSLLRTAARVKVATGVHGRTARRQQQRWAAEDQRAAAAAPAAPAAAPPPPPPPPAPAAAAPTDTSQMLEQLKQLGELRTAGILTDDEFEAKKAVILGG